ncbi:MAG: hypothetical protein Q9218_006728 [Villophora microphyllina]
MDHSDVPQHNPFWDQLIPYDLNTSSSNNVDTSWDFFSPANNETLSFNRGLATPHTFDPSISNSSICPARRYQRRNALSHFNSANSTSRTDNSPSSRHNPNNYSNYHHSHCSQRNSTTERNLLPCHSGSSLTLPPPNPSTISHQTFARWQSSPAAPALDLQQRSTPLPSIDSITNQYSPNIDDLPSFDATDYDSLFGGTNNLPEDFWADLTNNGIVDDIANDIANNPWSDSSQQTESENDTGSNNFPHFPHQDSNSGYGGFVDLTSSSPTDTTTMPPLTRKRSAAQMSPPVIPTASSPHHANINSNHPPTKRRRLSSTAATTALPPTTRQEKENDEPKEIAHLDLTSDDDNVLSKIVQEQQASAIRAQQQRDAQGDTHGGKEQEVTKLSNVTCIICMDTMTDMTVTHCGMLPASPRAPSHLFPSPKN